MFYHLLYPLTEYWSVFNVFKYITFRSSYATVTALLICFIFGDWVIRQLERMQIGETIRGATSGATGVVDLWDPNTDEVLLSSYNGTFQIGENIFGDDPVRDNDQITDMITAH